MQNTEPNNPSEAQSFLTGELAAVFAQRIGVVSGNGKTQDKLRCACGAVHTAYRWSWAGHGKTKCGSCGKWICYRTLQVFRCADELEWRRKLAANFEVTGAAPGKEQR